MAHPGPLDPHGPSYSLYAKALSTSGHTYTRTHAHAHTQAHTHMHAHTHAHTHMHAHTHAHTQAHTYIRTHVHMHSHAHTQAHTHTYACIHTSTHTHAHTHKHTHMHTQAHTHTGPHALSSPPSFFLSCLPLTFLAGPGWSAGPTYHTHQQSFPPELSSQHFGGWDRSILSPRQTEAVPQYQPWGGQVSSR